MGWNVLPMTTRNWIPEASHAASGGACNNPQQGVQADMHASAGRGMGKEGQVMLDIAVKLTLLLGLKCKNYWKHDSQNKQGARTGCEEMAFLTCRLAMSAWAASKR